MSRSNTKTAPEVGDVFLIPLDEATSVGGHVIAIRENEEIYIAIFDQRLSRNEINPDIVVAANPALLTLTFDAKFLHGDWPIIGNVEVNNRYPEPAYKIKHAGIMSIESRDKTVRRPATEGELDILQNRSVGSPAIIEDAIRSYFGLGEWSESYNKRLAEYASASSRLI